MTTTLSANGLLEIPEVFRKEDSLRPGSRCDIERLGRGEYRVVVKEDAVDKQDWVDILLNCPVKGWYEPLEAKETTDDLKPISFE